MQVWMKIRLRRFEEENKGNTGNREHQKETWIDFRKDLVGVGKAYHLTGLNGMKELWSHVHWAARMLKAQSRNLRKTRDEVMSQSEERVEAALAPFDEFKYLLVEDTVDGLPQLSNYLSTDCR